MRVGIVGMVSVAAAEVDTGRAGCADVVAGRTGTVKANW